MKKYTYLSTTDFFTACLVIKATIEALRTEIVSKKASDHKLDDLYDDFKKFIVKSDLESIRANVDVYPNFDVEDIAPRVESLEKKFKTILVAMYLEV